ncbi:MAG: ParB/RepB/Spo0J family partition protein [Thermodesulfobacteriota bacterium]
MGSKKLIKKSVLGRGLGALIKESSEAVAVASEGSPGGKRYFMCRVSEISPNRYQPRRTFDEESLKELSDSIREKGVIEPLIVKSGLDGYELIAGERRLRASKMAGLAEVPVVALDVTDEESLELAIIENIQREDLNAIEEAKAFQTLTGFGLSQEEVAKKVGKKRATVANYMRLLKLPMEVKKEIAKGTISMGHARALLSIESHGAQRDILKKTLSGDLSVRATEALVRKALSGEAGGGKAKRAPLRSPDITSIEENLRRVFSTKVSIKERGDKGRFEIEYFSKEERERLIELFLTLA